MSANGLGQINRYDGEGLRFETEISGKTAFYLFDRGELTAETGGDTVGRYARGRVIMAERKPMPMIWQETG